MATVAVVLHLLLTLSATVHSRESQFFAKVSNYNPQQTQPLNTNNNQQNDGGPYGHDSGQLPPSATTTTTTTNNNNNYKENNYNDNGLPANLPENYNPVAYTTPIHSSTQDIPDEFNDPQAYRYNGESRMYNSEKQGLSDTRFLENGRYYYNGDNGYNSQKQGFEDARFMETEDGGKMYNSEKQGEQMYNSQKHGMSDTRFLENGKYYYDLNMENLNANANMNSRGYSSRNEYNTQGYFGNNEKSYDRFNSNGGYENQEEFQGDQFNP